MALGDALLTSCWCLSAINNDVRYVQHSDISGGLVRFLLSFSISSRRWFQDGRMVTPGRQTPAYRLDLVGVAPNNVNTGH